MPRMLLKRERLLNASPDGLCTNENLHQLGVSISDFQPEAVTPLLILSVKGAFQTQNDSRYFLVYFCSLSILWRFVHTHPKQKPQMVLLLLSNKSFCPLCHPHLGCLPNSHSPLHSVLEETPGPSEGGGVHSVCCFTGTHPFHKTSFMIEHFHLCG